MNNEYSICIRSDNLSLAWGNAFQKVLDTPMGNFAPLIIDISGFRENEVQEDENIRIALSQKLSEEGKYSIDVSALTIFPFKSWKRLGSPAGTQFYEYALNRLLPWMKVQNKANRHGTYFERMMAYEGIKKGQPHKINQLEYIIDLWKKAVAAGYRPKRSDLQISLMDPSKDHTGARRKGFPCLQQVAFSYDDNGGMIVMAYYPTQYVFDRGYGNYLGLCHLGAFVAHELSLPLKRAIFFIGHPQLGTNRKQQSISKLALTELRRVVDSRVGLATT